MENLRLAVIRFKHLCAVFQVRSMTDRISTDLLAAQLRYDSADGALAWAHNTVKVSVGILFDRCYFCCVKVAAYHFEIV